MGCVTEQNQMLQIATNGRVFFQFSAISPCITVGKGNLSSKMSRGSFQFRDEIEQTLALQVKRDEDDENSLIFYHQNLNYVKLTCREDNAILSLRFVPLQQGLNRLWLTMLVLKQESFYGCGETFPKFNLRGEKVCVWVSEHQNAHRIAKKIIRETVRGKQPDKRLPFRSYGTYYAQPTFVSSEQYFVHVDSSAYMEFDFSQDTQLTLEIHDIPTIYIAKTNSQPELMGLLSNLLGRQPELPGWVYEGAILGIQGGNGTVDEKLKKARGARMKIAGIWCQDWEGERITAFGKQLMWNWVYDESLYPNLPQKIAEWNREGIRFLGYINPFLAVEKELYQYASAKGYCVKNQQGEDYMVKSTTFPAAMVDFTNPEAYEWIKNIIKQNMIGIGMSGWMADFGEYLPLDSVVYSGADPKEIHNSWPAIWAQINREAVEECGKLGEIIFFTRAGYTGTVKHSTLMWNGDQHVDWSVCDGIQSVIPATLSLAVSGFGLTHSDVGGYTTFLSIHRSKELLMRWAEMSAFSPVFRSHEGNQPDRNVQFDTDTQQLEHYARMSRVFHLLGPYLKECVKQNSEKGLAVMRPIFWHYSHAQALEEETQYLLGRDVLVAPVLKAGARGRTVFLPDDNWIHLWTGQTYTGGTVAVDAPYGYPPVFYRKEAAHADLFAQFKLLD